jgi:hypothetical protein
MEEKASNYQIVDLKNGTYVVKKYLGKNENKVAQYEKIGTIRQVSRSLAVGRFRANLHERRIEKREKGNKTLARQKKDLVEIARRSFEMLVESYSFSPEDSDLELSPIAQEVIDQKINELNEKLEIDRAKYTPRIIDALQYLIDDIFIEITEEKVLENTQRTLEFLALMLKNRIAEKKNEEPKLFFNE